MGDLNVFALMEAIEDRDERIVALTAERDRLSAENLKLKRDLEEADRDTTVVAALAEELRRLNDDDQDWGC